jgi:N-methylhydantoinase A
MSARFRLGVDIGGTFTDAVLLDEASGEIFIAKVLSTPSDPSIGFLEAVDRILKSGRAGAADLSYIVHGTTVATNALIEGKTPRTAFITTRGFRDMLEIGRQVRPTLYDVHFEKPRPLVPRNLCFEVAGRLDYAGHELEPLDEAAVRAIGAKLAAEDVVSVAVCLLHSYLNAAHEKRVAALLREVDANLLISLSADVCPEFREYFRASTTVINACVRPVLERYLKGIETRLRSRSIGAELLVMQSNGGVLTFETGAEKPAYMVESGPAAGVIVANFIAGELGHRNVISFDMGGTTAKVGVILDGRPKVTKEYEVGARALPGTGNARGGGYPIRTPVIDLVEIGAGGGSVGWVDAGDVLRVGPHSAGADPGPICYGRGGTDPTITDANLVLGRLDPRFFLGGEIALNVEAASEGVRARCASGLGMEVTACANGIVEIANAAMINALRIVTVQRGYDPRDLVMVAFGGAGPLHAALLCAEMQIPLLIVPPSPGTASALGLLVTDLKHEFSRTRIMPEGHEDVAAIQSVFEGMEADGRTALAREGLAATQMSFLRQVEMRYEGQSHEIAIDFPVGAVDEAALRVIRDRFHEEHDRTYGHGYPDQPTELVNLRLTAVGEIPKPRLREIPAARGDVRQAAKGARPVYFGALGDFAITTVYDRSKLGAGHSFAGPAVVEEVDCTTLVPPEFKADVDRWGNLLISPKPPAA